MNKQGEQEISRGEWSLGSDASAAGPMSSSTGGPEANGWKTPVLVYTTSTGAYAGASLEGSKISVDNGEYAEAVRSKCQPASGSERRSAISRTGKSFLATLNEVTK